MNRAQLERENDALLADDLVAAYDALRNVRDAAVQS